MTQQVITKTEAKVRGLKRYFTGVPCNRGHLSERNISGACVECKREYEEKRDPEYYKKWRANNRDKCKAYHDKARDAGYNKEYYKKNREREIAEAQAWRAKNLVRAKEASRDWYARNRERNRSASLQYYHENKEAIRVRSRVWRERTSDIRREKSKEWRLRNPEKVSQYARNARAKRANAPGRITPAEAADILNLQRGKCAMCQTKLGSKKHLDHIIPIARGGANTRRNAQYLCASCNHRKHAKDPIDFAREKGFLL